MEDCTKVRMPNTDMPGAMLGRTTRWKAPKTEQPSIVAASSISSGIDEAIYWRIQKMPKAEAQAVTQKGQ